MLFKKICIGLIYLIFAGSAQALTLEGSSASSDPHYDKDMVARISRFNLEADEQRGSFVRLLKLKSGWVTVQKQTTAGLNSVTLFGLNLNNQGKTVTATPEQEINGIVGFIYNCPTCGKRTFNQIIIGIANKGAQACLFNGGIQEQGIRNFKIIAPKEPGFYEIRFRYAQDYDCENAIKSWWDRDGVPGQDATVGYITVR